MMADVMFFVLIVISTISSIAMGKTCQITSDSTLNRVTADCRNLGLKAVPRSLPINMTVLLLKGNDFQVLANDSFKQYTSLIYLDISSCDIRALQKGVFNGLLNLKQLNMGNNKLNLSSSYESTVFIPIDGLEMLDISENMPKQLSYSPAVIYPATSLSVLHRLDTLSIDLMPNPFFEIGFRKLKLLKTLRFDYCLLNNLTNDTFVNFTDSIRELYLTNCKHFFRVETNALAPFLQLSILDLSNTYIHLIQALRVLLPFQDKTMKTINFHHVTDYNNNMDEFPYALTITKDMVRFLKTICVHEIDISENGIVDFEQNSLLTFNQPTCIHKAILSANRFALTSGYHLADVATFLFEATNLAFLDASYFPLRFPHPTFLNMNSAATKQQNRLTNGNKQISSDIHLSISVPDNLQYIRLSHIMGSPDFDTVVFNNSKLSHLDVSYGLQERFVNIEVISYLHVQVLDISGNDCTLFSSKPSWQILKPFLLTLIMKDTNLYKCLGDALLLNGTKHITHLDMSHNYIININKQLFTEMPNLRLLNISNNFLRQLPDLLNGVKQMSKLDLTFNFLISIDKKFSFWIDGQISTNSSVSVFLDGNPLSCLCDTRDFVTWLHTTGVILDNGGNYPCVFPDATEGNTTYAYDNFKSIFNNCELSWFSMKNVVILAASFLGTILIIICVYKCRKNILFFVLKNLNKLAMRELVYIYDVYLGFTDNVSTDSKEKILNKLKHEWHLNVYTEDSIKGGIPWMSPIANACDNSRYGIFVLMENTKKQHALNYSIAKAVTSFNQNKMSRIVCIIDNEIEARDFPQPVVDEFNTANFHMIKLKRRNIRASKSNCNNDLINENIDEMFDKLQRSLFL